MSSTSTPNALAVGERECAAALNMSVAWLRKDRCSAKIIPFSRLGKSVRYDLDRVRVALASVEEGGTAAKGKRSAKCQPTA